MSLSFGMLCNTTFFSKSNEAAIIGKAPFFEPEISIAPSSSFEPFITNLSII